MNPLVSFINQDNISTIVEMKGMSMRRGKGGRSKASRRKEKKLRSIKLAIYTTTIALVLLICAILIAYLTQKPSGESGTWSNNHNSEQNQNSQTWWKTYTPSHGIGSGSDEFTVEYGSEYTMAGTAVLHPSWISEKLSSKPVFILVHSTSCAPCIQQGNDAQTVKTKYGSDFEFVDVYTDDQSPENQEVVSQIYSIYYDPAYPQSIPLTIIMTKVQRIGVEIGWQSYVGATGYDTLEGWVKDSIYYYKQSTGYRSPGSRDAQAVEKRIVCELFDSGDKDICDCSNNATDALYQLKKENSSLVVLDCPTFGDLATPYGISRSSFYSIERFPMLVIDGIIFSEGGNNTSEYYQRYKYAIDARYNASRASQASISIIGEGIRNYSCVKANVNVSAIPESYDHLKLVSVLYKEALEFGKTRRYVASALVCETVLDGSSMQTVNLNFSTSPADNTTIYWLASFVQNAETNEIIQSSEFPVEFQPVSLPENFSEPNSTESGTGAAPTISDVQYSPRSPVKKDNVTVSAMVQDADGDLAYVKVRYCGSFCTIPINMTKINGMYTNTIAVSPFAAGEVQFHIEAKDEAGHISYYNGSFFVKGEEVQKPNAKQDGVSPMIILGTVSAIVIIAVIAGFAYHTRKNAARSHEGKTKPEASVKKERAK